jgi:methylated-DNA-protein-cysteine methyltransferase-like protein
MKIPDDAARDAHLMAQVYEIVRAIPAGRVLSYGAVGARCEPPISGYICGRILQNVPDGVPWWRVVGKNGNLPISKRHPELSREQRTRLESEGVAFDDKGQVLMEEFGG